MKKIVVLSMMLFTLLSVSTVSADGQVGVVIDGVGVRFTDAVPFIDENGRTLVPLRAVGEAMGLTVNWDSQRQEAVFIKEYTWEDSPLYNDIDEDGENDAYLGLEKVTFKIDDNIAQYEESWHKRGTLPNESFPVSGGIGEIPMDTSAIIKDSRTYAPIRYLAEAFRYDVGWEADTVVINHMYSRDKLGIQTDLVACWEDSQGWLLTAVEESDIQTIDIFNVSINGETSEYRILTEDERASVYDSGEDFGKYLIGFTVEKNLTVNSHYDYEVKFLVTMKDGTQKFGFAHMYLYFDGGQGGYI